MVSVSRWVVPSRVRTYTDAKYLDLLTNFEPFRGRITRRPKLSAKRWQIPARPHVMRLAAIGAMPKWALSVGELSLTNGKRVTSPSQTRHRRSEVPEKLGVSANFSRILPRSPTVTSRRDLPGDRLVRR